MINGDLREQSRTFTPAQPAAESGFIAEPLL